MEIVETHCHLNNEQYIHDLPQVLERAQAVGVAQFVNVGWDESSSKKAVEQAKAHENIRAVIGIHPHDATGASQDSLGKLRELAKNDVVVAWGEIGLDYYYDNSPRDVQREAFRQQLGIAKGLGLPVVIHSRDAAKDTLDILAEFAPLHGVMHCFSGSWETASICMDLGLYIGFAGPITFKNAHRLREVVAKVPLERTLVETDCPYLSPEPVRGRRNEPANLAHILVMLAKIKGKSVEQVAGVTTGNARAVFALPVG